jgi:hypothetical protein
MSEPTPATKCDGSRDPRQRCGAHHRTGLPWICGGLECCCGDSWLDTQNICSTGAEPGTPVSLKDRLDSLLSWANTADERMAVADFVFAQLPPDGRGRWRQGTKNPRNLYVHQGDDEVGRPVGQLYSAELAALVCDAVNAQQARGEA